VSVASPDLLVVRGYALKRMPGLIESMLSERLSGPVSSSSPLKGEVEIRLRKGTYTKSSNLSLSDVEDGRRNIMSPPDADEQRGAIMWFGIDYVVRNPKTGRVTSGFLPAYGPEPESFNGIQLHERAVAAGVAARLERRINQLLGNS
jgi:hypothetical protein